MSQKWGSCSTAGTITLASDLDDESPQFQDFVIVHELLHMKVRNHGRLFKALMTAHVPSWRTQDLSRKHPTRKSGAIPKRTSEV
jgi:predicted metal-dependent hydrolase